jgi:drug/metabolite transporter (DMT)-like permease
VFSSVLLVGVLYIVPAFLYCLYNNLQFINLSNYDPTTYYILLQFRVVVTGLVYEVLTHTLTSVHLITITIFFALSLLSQCLFKRRLSRIQWLSLFVLTAGCIVKELGHKSHISTDDASSNSRSGSPFFGIKLNTALVLMVIQTLCSCIAAVYNEYLLKGRYQPQKDDSAATPLMIQNIFMYGNSVICNVLFLAAKGEFLQAMQLDSIKSILQLKVAVVMLNSAVNGIVTSLFLKELNAILKTFANALEIVLTAFVTFILFNTPLDGYAGLAIILVLLALITYNTSPLRNQALVEQKRDVSQV